MYTKIKINSAILFAGLTKESVENGTPVIYVAINYRLSSNEPGSLSLSTSGYFPYKSKLKIIKSLEFY